MPCDTRLKPRQTIQERKAEVLAATERFNKGLVSGRVRAIVSPKGGITFTGLSDTERDGVTDACVYRRLLTSGSALAITKIKQAEMLAGRAVDKQVLASGHHSHDGGKTWHDGH